MLYRAHVPILNVKYDGNACRPYLDWQYEEGMIRADEVDVAPGFRLFPAHAKTILDTGDDTGNFLGIGIFVDDCWKSCLSAGCTAGWYRYVSEWRLHADGTICPRFGFSAVSSSCVCTMHHHHAYWRLDFDIRTAGNERRPRVQRVAVVRAVAHEAVRDPAAAEPSAQPPVARSEHSDRRGLRHRARPGDGVATASPDWPFPQGDVWIVRYRGSEIDNGVHATGPPYEANIGNFVNGESIENTDVVVWYARSLHCTT